MTGLGDRTPPRRRGEEAAWAVGFVALYVLLDWVSFIQPYGGLDITPWNPPPGLGLAFLLLRGLGWWPMLFVAGLASDLVTRHLSLPLVPTLLGELVVTIGYAAAAWVLARRLRIDPRLSTLRDVLQLVGVMIPTALLVAAGYIAVYHWFGLIPLGDVGTIWMRYWIGDMIGVAIFAPLCLTVGQGPLPPGLRAPPSPWVSLVQGLSILLALWIVFGGDLAQHPSLYYPLFMPLVWVGAWHGLQGVTVALFATQVGMIIAIEEARLDAEALTEVQFFLLALTLTCLLLGAIVTERRKVGMALRDSQSRLRAIFEVAPEGMLSIDDRGLVDTVNPAFCRLAGRPAEAMIGSPPDALFPELAVLLARAGGEGQLTRPDGSSVTVEVSVGETPLSQGHLRVAAVHGRA